MHTKSFGTDDIPYQNIVAADLEDTYQKDYANTVIVSPVGTTTENGINLRNQLSSITDAAFDNPYLLKIEPGTYDLWQEALEMKDFVDIEGAGVDVTIIQSATNGTFTRGVVNGSDNAEIRDLSIVGSSSDVSLIGIYLDSGANTSIKNVAIELEGATNSLRGIDCDSSNPTIDGVDIEIDGTGSGTTIGIRLETGSGTTINNSNIFVDGATNNFAVSTLSDIQVTHSSLGAEGGANAHGIDALDSNEITIYNSLIQGQGGTTSYGLRNGQYTIDKSVIQGDTNAISTSSSVKQGFTQNANGVTGGGTFVCAHCYDENNYTLPSNCVQP